MDFFSDPQAMLANTSLVERFLDYVKIHTTSDEHSDSCPSTERQFVLAKLLVEQLRAMGLSDAAVDENCYVTAPLPGNVAGKETVGLIAHLKAVGDAAAGGVDDLHPVMLDVGRKQPAAPGRRSQGDQTGIRWDRRADLVPGTIHHRDSAVPLGRHVGRPAQARILDCHRAFPYRQVFDFLKLLGVDH